MHAMSLSEKRQNLEGNVGDDDDQALETQLKKMNQELQENKQQLLQLIIATNDLYKQAAGENRRRSLLAKSLARSHQND